MHLYKKFLCVLPIVKLQSVTPLYNTACNPCKTIQTLFNMLNIFCVVKMFLLNHFLYKCNNKMHLYKKLLCVLLIVKLQSITSLYRTTGNPCNTWLQQHTVTPYKLCSMRWICFCVFFNKLVFYKCNYKMHLYKNTWSKLHSISLA